MTLSEIHKLSSLDNRKLSCKLSLDKNTKHNICMIKYKQPRTYLLYNFSLKLTNPLNTLWIQQSNCKSKIRQKNILKTYYVGALDL